MPVQCRAVCGVSSVACADIRGATLSANFGPVLCWRRFSGRSEVLESERYRSNRVNRAATYATAIVVAHLLVNIAHGLGHRELRIGLPVCGSVFVIVVVLVCPLLAMALVWTTKKRIGLILLSLSMFGSLLFGFYHHFLVASPDHVRLQPASAWGIAFVLTAYGLLITEAIGAYIGIHFLWIARGTSSKVVKT